MANNIIWMQNAGNAYQQILDFIDGIQDADFQLDAKDVRKWTAERAKFWQTYKPNCRNCAHYRNTESGEMCVGYGYYPDNIKPTEYSCSNWEFDDVPF